MSKNLEKPKIHMCCGRNCTCFGADGSKMLNIPCQLSKGHCAAFPGFMVTFSCFDPHRAVCLIHARTHTPNKPLCRLPTQVQWVNARDLKLDTHVNHILGHTITTMHAY